ncbi:tryptophan 2,3-dioxygenase [Punctularia strigosozonata HHB-11173 SS5]|uniref:tryptophan 2,3-dioxygenase n=1 Tax=Punctularia strigosozonata (strain HHB-11173) TaxID=741275 RepID=UPI00044182A6|nr:tryptophan 2,3-dioxygenase [Punctularia strigosozonata HHB-11173 SS5]EIN12338.1 tryptophan 2,3-dioxygenase [Punctularia strigosozonata HHB-11173 SS5]
MTTSPNPSQATSPLAHLSAQHFLTSPRPDALASRPAGVPDTTTLAAHDFDVDTRTGFMPPEPPLTRLPARWDRWEDALEDAIHSRLQLASKPQLTQEQLCQSERWRTRVREIPLLSIQELASSEVLLRRAHHVLAWLLHFYVHTLPLAVPILIPRSISVPLFQVCAQLRLPPVLTYSDDVLYNWAFKPGSAPSDSEEPPLPTIDNITTVTTFTQTRSESEFYLASARIELRGAEALALMQAMMDEAFVSDALAFSRITSYLLSLSAVIDALTSLLLAVREGCDPEEFYHDIRPWFKGEDAADAEGARKWVFEGIEEFGLQEPVEKSGPSAGQSALVHALDVFLGVDEYSHHAALTGRSSSSPSPTSSSSSQPRPQQHQQAFLTRMQSYMPRHHRAFLNHLSANPRPLRSLVLANAASFPELLDAYNDAVRALKRFRDSHMRVVAMYIVGPSARERQQKKEMAAREQEKAEGEEEDKIKGTGGTELVRFLKGVRDRTASAVISEGEDVALEARGKVMSI